MTGLTYPGQTYPGDIGVLPVAAPITGTLAVTLGVLTLSSTAVLPIFGSASVTLGALTLASTGAAPIAGSLTKTLGVLTLGSTGVLPIVGSLSQVLGLLTLSSTNAVPTSALIKTLTVNVLLSNTWTQLLESGLLYSVPSLKSAIATGLRALNEGFNSATVEFAISADSSISDAERVWVPLAVAAGQMKTDVHGVTHLMQPSEAIWARVVGASPNVTFRVDIQEVK